MLNNFDKINFLEMSEIALTKWIRSESQKSPHKAAHMGIMQSLQCARLIKEAHRDGELRGRVVKDTGPSIWISRIYEDDNLQ